MVEDAPDFVIQAAYRACIKKFHPDHYKASDARQRTEAILEAYRLIGTPEARADFDASRRKGNSPPPPPPPREPPKRSQYSDDEPVPNARKSFPSWLVPVVASVPLAVVIVANSLNGSEEAPSPVVAVDAISASDAVNAADAADEEPTLPVLDEVLRFTTPSDCEMTPATAKLFDNLMIFDPPEYVGRRGPPVRLPDFEGPLVPTFSRTVNTDDGLNVRDNEATLLMAGTWHGLRVSKIRVRAMEESSFWEQQIRFFEPAPRVRATLNQLGFDIPPIGQFREFTGTDVVSAGIGVEEIPGGSALYCGSSIYY